MTYGYSTDPEVDRSTNRVMAWGVVLLIAIVLAFPIYLNTEPASREAARTENVESLAAEGESIWAFNCASCHGENGEGITAPALYSKEFLQSVHDDQISLLVSVGIPGSPMPSFSQDFAGPLTTEQIKAVTTYLRSREDEAPSVPGWRTPTTQANNPTTQETTQSEVSASGG